MAKIDLIALAAAKKFTADTVDGLGAVKGAPCTIKSITDNGDGTHTVAFEWESDSGAKSTSNLIIADGKDGTDGTDAVQISSIVATDDHKIKVIMADGTEYETVEIPTEKGDDGVSPTATAERVTNGAKITITDASGTTTATAQDGLSPVATVARNAQNDGVVISITDKNGTTSQNVYDGSVAATLDYGTSITNRPKVNGVELVGNRTTAELGINIPTKNSQLTNDSGYITASDIPTVDNALSQVSENAVSNKAITTEIRATQETVNDLVSEVGQNTSAIDILNGSATTDGSVKKQIADAIANIDKLTKKIVDTLPDVEDAEENIIYLIENPDGEGYLQYMLVTNDVGAKTLASLGGTNIDLTEYYTKTETDTLLAEKQASVTGAASTVTTMNVTANRALVSNSNGKIAVSAVKASEIEALTGIEDNIQQQIDGKADTFDTDTIPTQNSENLMTSGAIFTALSGKQGTLNFDSAPTASSLNPVTSGGVSTALGGKQDKLTFDDRPKENSENVLSSGVIYNNLASTLQSAKDYTDTQIASVGGFEVVDSLDDVTEPNTKKLYLVYDDTAEGDDKYKEYIYEVNAGVGEFKLIGDTTMTINKATTTTAGIVKPDGSTITVDADGTIHGASVTPYDDTAITERVSEIEDKVTPTKLTNENLNDIRTEGTYFANGVDTCTNKPFATSYNFVMQVYKMNATNNAVIQYYISANSLNDNRNAVYTRQISDSSIGDWRKVIIEGDLDNINAVIPTTASASNQLITRITANDYLTNLGWGSFSGSTIGESVVAGVNSLLTSIDVTRSYMLRGTYPAVGYWQAFISPPRTPSGHMWQAFVQYERVGTDRHTSRGLYVVEFSYDSSADAGSQFTLVNESSVVKSSDLTSTVTSGSTAPLQSGALYPKIGSSSCDSNLFSSGSRVNYTTSGKIVVLYANNITTINNVSGNIASGFPKPITVTYGIFTDTEGKAYTVAINTNTALSSTIPSGKTLNGQMVYMAE